jgi:hypothetical protein
MVIGLTQGKPNIFLPQIHRLKIELFLNIICETKFIDTINIKMNQ